MIWRSKDTRMQMNIQFESRRRSRVCIGEKKKMLLERKEKTELGRLVFLTGLGLSLYLTDS
jgi:hypothetical protein